MANDESEDGVTLLMNEWLKDEGNLRKTATGLLEKPQSVPDPAERAATLDALRARRDASFQVYAEISRVRQATDTRQLIAASNMVARRQSWIAAAVGILVAAQVLVAWWQYSKPDAKPPSLVCPAVPQCPAAPACPAPVVSIPTPLLTPKGAK